MSNMNRQTMTLEDALARGKELVQEIRTIVQKAQEPKTVYPDILKWDRNQPRGPKGSPEGGRWVAGASAGEGSTPGAFSTPLGMSRQQGNAGYADIMNAPTGTGFGNTPRITGDAEMVTRLTTPPTPPPSHTLEVLKSASVADSHPLGDGGNANASVVVTLDDADGTEAVYKPERGENWTASFANSDINQYVRNRQFSLAARETFASEVDTTLGLHIVPETVLRENVDESNIEVDTSGGAHHGGGGGYDEDEARQEYDKFREKAQESALDAVGGQMGDLFRSAQREHKDDIENRAGEMADIWNELVDEYPNLEAEREAASAVRDHPVLPLGSKPPFERKESLSADPVDPLEVLDDAGVDVSSKMNDTERGKVKEILRKKMLEEGATELGDIDESVAKSHLQYDTWIENHYDTEARLVDEQIPSFTNWRQQHGYESSYGGSGSGGGFNKNDQAPHPNGGSFQLFRNVDSYGSLSEEGGAKLAVLDYVIGSMDRHPSNLMFDGNDPVAIDNGYSMPASDGPDNFTFRSHGVRSWLGDTGVVPEDLRQQLHESMGKTDWQALVDRHPGMNAKERAAFLGRVGKATTALETQNGMAALWRRLDNMY